MKNIETFDRFVGFVFAELYESFPVCKKIVTQKICEAGERTGEKNELIMSETMFWLKDTGYLAFSAPKEKSISYLDGSTAYPEFQCTVLTAKGLETLKMTPKSIDRAETIGEKIIGAVKSGAKEEISRLVSSTLSVAIGALV